MLCSSHLKDVNASESLFRSLIYYESRALGFRILFETSTMSGVNSTAPQENSFRGVEPEPLKASWMAPLNCGDMGGCQGSCAIRTNFRQ